MRGDVPLRFTSAVSYNIPEFADPGLSFGSGSLGSGSFGKITSQKTWRGKSR